MDEGFSDGEVVFEEEVWEVEDDEDRPPEDGMAGFCGAICHCHSV